MCQIKCVSVGHIAFLLHLWGHHYSGVKKVSRSASSPGECAAVENIYLHMYTKYTAKYLAIAQQQCKVNIYTISFNANGSLLPHLHFCCILMSCLLLRDKWQEGNHRICHGHGVMVIYGLSHRADKYHVLNHQQIIDIQLDLGQ